MENRRKMLAVARRQLEGALESMERGDYNTAWALTRCAVVFEMRSRDVGASRAA